MIKKEISSFLAILIGVICGVALTNQLELLPPLLLGGAIAFIIMTLRKIKFNKSGIPSEDERTEANVRKVMLVSLLWSHLLLGLALIVWQFLGHESVPSMYIILYISAVFVITWILMIIARKK